MKKLIIILAFCLLMATPALAEEEKTVHAAAAPYRVTLTRLDTNHYNIEWMTGWSLVTKYCYEYVYYDDALLYYSPYDWNNRVVFSDGSECQLDFIQACDIMK